MKDPAECRHLNIVNDRLGNWCRDCGLTAAEIATHPHGEGE